MRRRSIVACAALMLSGCATTGAGSDEPPSGRALAEAKNCVSCHSVNGSRSVGPTWRSLFGAEVELADGRVVIADASYLERSMREPQADIVAGFTTVAMPSIELSEAEIAALVAYIESLDRFGSLG